MNQFLAAVGLQKSAKNGSARKAPARKVKAKGKGRKKKLKVREKNEEEPTAKRVKRATSNARNTVLGSNDLVQSILSFLISPMIVPSEGSDDWASRNSCHQMRRSSKQDVGALKLVSKAFSACTDHLQNLQAPAKVHVRGDM